MTKKIFTFSLLVTICAASFFACKKVNKSTEDATRNYFPLKFGKYVTYAVDSIYYIDTSCERIEVKSQMKYAITDTFTDKKKRLSYIMDVYSRPYEGGLWKQTNVILITPTATELLYSQDNAQYVKLMFPISEGFTWSGNKYVPTQNPAFSYLSNWNYNYLDYHLSYNNGYINFDNTVTVLEHAQNINNPNIDSAVKASTIYAKEVYAYNVGMIYKEWTYTTYRPDTVKCLKGYSVVMRAIDYN
ncbi:MAG: hypothetical protein JWQ38_449 [Flavipsychrobacter sp.]|nr:hypothetical protein [Flavipsychrobacter sp.]